MRLNSFKNLIIAAVVSTMTFPVLAEPEKPDTAQPGYIPVEVKKDNPNKHLRVPAKGILIDCYVETGAFNVTVPESLSSGTVILEQMDSPFGYWIVPFSQPQVCEIGFDGSIGDYKLTISSEGSSYIGYFTLE